MNAAAEAGLAVLEDRGYHLSELAEMDPAQVRAIRAQVAADIARGRK